MVSQKSNECKARLAISLLDKPRSRRAVFPVALAFHHRYVTKRLRRLNITTFVQLVARLKTSQLLDVINGPGHLLDELSSYDADFETKWHVVFDKGRDDVQTRQESSLFLLEVAAYYLVNDHHHAAPTLWKELARELSEELNPSNLDDEEKPRHLDNDEQRLAWEDDSEQSQVRLNNIETISRGHHDPPSIQALNLFKDTNSLTNRVQTTQHYVSSVDHAFAARPPTTLGNPWVPTSNYVASFPFVSTHHAAPVPNIGSYDPPSFSPSDIRQSAPYECILAASGPELHGSESLS